MQTAHHDPVLASLQGGGLGQPPDPVLGRGVGRHILARALGRDTPDVDDAALAPGLHDPERLPGAQKGAGQAGADDPVPGFQTDLFDRPAVEGAGIVEQDIQLPEALHGLREERFHLGLLRHIRGHGQDFCAFLRQLAGCFPQKLRPSGRDHQIGALLGQAPGNALADAAVRPGYHRDLSA